MESEQLELASRLSYAGALLLLSYTSFHASWPPNWDREGKGDRQDRDDVSTAFAHKGFFYGFGGSHAAIAIWTAFLALFPPTHYSTVGDFSKTYPNRMLLEWNWFSAVTVLGTIGGGLIRLASYRSLGKNFTFNLQRPAKLHTSGLYHYVQHPSYLGAYMIVIFQSMLFHRLDGPLATVLPPWIVEQSVWSNWLFWIWTPFICGVLTLRMKQEEAMLKKTFGKQWVDWNRRTARLIPYIF